MTSSSDHNDDDKGVIPETERREIKNRLDQLGDKLDAAQSKRPKPPSEEGGRSAMGVAFRLAVEMVAGVAVGGMIGYALDAWTGAQPLFFIACLILGGVAGIVNSIRVARRMQSNQG